MRKKILLFLILFFIFSPNVLAANNCISSISPNGSMRRANGHQSQWFSNGSFVSNGTVSSSCISISGYSSSVVNLRVSGNSFQFSPQGTGQTSATYTVSPSCSCSGSAISKTVVFTFSEWGLRGLVVSGYELSPNFSNMVSEYSITVPTNVDSVTLSFAPLESRASVKLNGTLITSYYDVKANIINNKIEINVTTSVGDSRTTVIKVKRSAAAASSSKSNLFVCPSGTYSTRGLAEYSALKSCAYTYTSSSDSNGCWVFNCDPLPNDNSTVEPASSSQSSKSSSKVSSKTSSAKPSSSSRYIEPTSYPDEDYDDSPETGSADIIIVAVLLSFTFAYSFWYYRNYKNMNYN